MGEVEQDGDDVQPSWALNGGGGRGPGWAVLG